MARLDPNLLPAAGIAASVAAEVLLARFLLRLRRAGGLRLDGLPVLPVPPAEIFFFLAILLLAMGLLGGLGFGLGAAAGTAFLLWRNGVSPARYFGPGPRLIGGAGRAFALGAWIVAAAYLPLQLFSGGMEALFQHLGWPTPPEPAISLFLAAHGWRLAAVLLAAVVLAPLGEEALFRGLLLPALRQRFPPGIAVLLSALLFAAIHAHGVTFLPLAAFGMVLGLAYALSGSLLLCIAIHLWFNLLTALLLLAGYGNPAS